MKGSRVLQQLRAGKVATCTKVNLDSSRAVEIAAMTGVDCIWLCTEHVLGKLHPLQCRPVHSAPRARARIIHD